MGYDVFCFRGHGNGDPGATGNGYKEVDIAQSFVTRINELLKNKGLSVLTNSLNQNNYQLLPAQHRSGLSLISSRPAFFLRGLAPAT